MGRHTPQMTNAELKAYLEQHLANELHWLLRAAAEWHIQNQVRLQVDGYHMQVYAMDAAFLHARTLFEFFTQKTTDNYYGCDIYGLAVLQSPLYQNNWKSTLHAYMMHAQDRSKPQKLKSFDGATAKDLNKMPVDFGMEVLRLWREFSLSLQNHQSPNIQALAKVANQVLSSAVNDANKVMTSNFAKSYAFAQLKW